MNTELAEAGPTYLSADLALYKLQTWFSPSYPVGAYTYSHGLENAFETGLVNNAEEAIAWIGDLISIGSGFADAVFLAAIHRAAMDGDFKRVAQIAELAVAFCGTRELRLESHSQGDAFLEILQKIEPMEALDKLTKYWSGPYPYCVVAGTACAGAKIDPSATVGAYLHGFVSNLSSALVRIIPLGQTDGQRIIAALAPHIGPIVVRAMETKPEDLSTSALMVDVTSIQHETQYTRLFRS